MAVDKQREKLYQAEYEFRAWCDQTPRGPGGRAGNQLRGSPSGIPALAGERATTTTLRAEIDELNGALRLAVRALNKDLGVSQ